MHTLVANYVHTHTFIIAAGWVRVMPFPLVLKDLEGKHIRITQTDRTMDDNDSQRERERERERERVCACDLTL